MSRLILFYWTKEGDVKAVLSAVQRKQVKLSFSFLFRRNKFQFFVYLWLGSISYRLLHKR